MTKKDYIAIAAAFARTRPTDILSPAGRQWDRDIRAMADVFYADNPRFSIARYLGACSVDVSGWVVGRNDGVGDRRKFTSYDEAVSYLDNLPNQTEVVAGCYYLDSLTSEETK